MKFRGELPIVFTLNDYDNVLKNGGCTQGFNVKSHLRRYHNTTNLSITTPLYVVTEESEVGQ